MIKKSKQWSKKEIQLLQSIKKKYKEKKWKLISKDFAKKGFKRSQHQCRHKWVNYLNPEINHEAWSDEQLQILYRQYQNHHTQWSIIQKFLPNRTQIKIKNHFYGVLRNLTRSILKFFKQVPGKQSQISNKINPKQLQYIYNGEKCYQFLGDLTKKAVKKMQYKFRKNMLMKEIEENRQKYSKLNECLLKSLQASQSENQKFRIKKKEQQSNNDQSSNQIDQNENLMSQKVSRQKNDYLDGPHQLINSPIITSNLGSNYRPQAISEIKVDQNLANNANIFNDQQLYNNWVEDINYKNIGNDSNVHLNSYNFVDNSTKFTTDNYGILNYLNSINANSNLNNIVVMDSPVIQNKDASQNIQKDPKVDPTQIMQASQPQFFNLTSLASLQAYPSGPRIIIQPGMITTITTTYMLIPEGSPQSNQTFTQTQVQTQINGALGAYVGPDRYNNLIPQRFDGNLFTVFPNTCQL